MAHPFTTAQIAAMKPVERLLRLLAATGRIACENAAFAWVPWWTVNPYLRPDQRLLPELLGEPSDLLPARHPSGTMVVPGPRLSLPVAESASVHPQIGLTAGAEGGTGVGVRLPMHLAVAGSDEVLAQARRWRRSSMRRRVRSHRWLAHLIRARPPPLPGPPP